MQEFRLIIMRHGEAGNDAQRDFERQLTARGVKAVEEAAKRMHSLGWIPDIIISSDAQRTKQTSLVTEKILCELTSKNIPIQYQNAFYLGRSKDVESFLLTRSKNHAESTICLIGHNPTWSMLASIMADDLISMSPANAVLLKINADSLSDALHMQGLWQLVEIL